MVRDILTLPDGRLLKPAVEFDMSEESSIERAMALVTDLMDTIDDVEGLGLAAPQIGENVRVIVLRHQKPLPDSPDREHRKWGIINPRVTKRSGIKMPSFETCLSVPGITVKKTRHASVTVEGLRADGVPVKYDLKGLAACVMQHEIDHLDGVVLTAPPPKVQRVRPRPFFTGAT